jgi:hypothetical protein
MSASNAVLESSSALEAATRQLQTLQQLLVEGDIDDRLLRDFRAALNRLRNTAWAVQQYVGQKAIGQDAASVLTILAGERIRAAHDLCRAISSDLKRPDIEFQSGSLVELHEVVQKLSTDIAAWSINRRDHYV